ncbi:hypothetical protein FQN50_003950 [Emmonsiellopsis sp. PD_5]|nr:hypothetical protein FQN50_003950 [Emmonsiellopsis sp. PD_5]
MPARKRWVQQTWIVSGCANTTVMVSFETYLQVPKHAVRDARNTGAFDDEHVLKDLSNLIENGSFSVQKGYAGSMALGLRIVVCEKPPGFHEASFLIQKLNKDEVGKVKVWKAKLSGMGLVQYGYPD